MKLEHPGTECDFVALIGLRVYPGIAFVDGEITL